MSEAAGVDEKEIGQMENGSGRQPCNAGGCSLLIAY